MLRNITRGRRSNSETGGQERPFYRLNQQKEEKLAERGETGEYPGITTFNTFCSFTWGLWASSGQLFTVIPGYFL